MRIVYFDEVKPNPGAFEDFLLAGVSIASSDLKEFLARFKEIRGQHYDKLGLEHDVELHAAYVYHGKGAFKKKDLETRGHG